MGKLERKFGKYAIKNLSTVLVICYALGYLLQMVPAFNFLFNYITLDPYKILHGQVWRLFTWILIPPQSFTLLTLITLFFYWSIGRSLERAWGDWLYNLYIFGGMLFTFVGSLILLGYFVLITGNYAMAGVIMETVAYYFSTYYVNMSILLAFAATFPDVTVLLMFIIPIKVKWLGILYGVFMGYQFIMAVIGKNFVTAVVMVVSLLNFMIFFFYIMKKKKGSPRQMMHNAARRRDFNRDVHVNVGISKHKCAICGRTDTDYPDLEFRFCSKCNGNYEYCNDHIFTHKHIQ